MCRMRGKIPESFAHVLGKCSSLAQTKYIERHNAALKVLFFAMLRGLKLAKSSLVLTGGAQIVVRTRKRSSILGCFCLYRTHFRSIQQGGCAICRPQSDEDVGCRNELSFVGQSFVEGF